MSRQKPVLLDLSEFLPYRLSIITNKISRALSTLYTDRFDISIPEWRVMAVLGQYPGMSADEVCAKTELDKVSVSRAVTKLLGKEHISREFSEQDRRRSILHLSSSGYGIYTQIVPLAKKFEKQFISRLSIHDQELLDSLLNKLNENAGALSHCSDTK